MLHTGPIKCEAKEIEPWNQRTAGKELDLHPSFFPLPHIVLLTAFLRITESFRLDRAFKVKSTVKLT